MAERTLFIIKPDAVGRNLIGKIIARIEEARFRVRNLKMVRLTEAEARRFYYVHEGKPFLPELVQFMSSGNVVPMVLEKENAVSGLRTLIGATDPKEAAPGTIRADFATDKGKNAVHASDSLESAKFEIDFFFGNER